jgi:hypothetical protein
MISIDGVSFNIPIVSLKRSAQFLDKYAQRTEDGDLKRKLIGVYFNYSLKLAKSSTIGEKAYQQLWDKLTEAVEYHTVTVPGNGGNYTFKAYHANIADELQIQTTAEENYWKNLTVDFLAKAPALIPS